MTLHKTYTGWWFQPLWKILVSWDDYSQYVYIYMCVCMENKIMFETTSQYKTDEQRNSTYVCGSQCHASEDELRIPRSLLPRTDGQPYHTPTGWSPISSWEKTWGLATYIGESWMTFPGILWMKLLAHLAKSMFAQFAVDRSYLYPPWLILNSKLLILPHGVAGKTQTLFGKFPLFAKSKINLALELQYLVHTPFLRLNILPSGNLT